jgi:hypothetical protein
MKKDFRNDSLPKGDAGQEVCEELFNWFISRNKIIDYKRTEHTEYKGLPYERDYVWILNDNETVGVEVKSLAGEWKGKACDTLVIEIYQNFARNKRPGWWRAVDADELAFVFFVNRFENKVYMFHAAMLQSWIDNEETKGTLQMTKCGDGNEDNNGYLAKVPWQSKAAGFLRAYPFKKL